MTEEQWLSCDDWRPIIAYLSGKISKRKGTLYVCAGLRCISHLLYDDGSWTALDIAERAADGLADEGDIGYAGWSAEPATFGFDFDPEMMNPYMIDGSLDPSVQRLIEMGIYTEADIREWRPSRYAATVEQISNAAHIAYHSTHTVSENRFDPHLLDHLVQQSDWPGGWLIREIFGNPFRPTHVNPEWLAWKRGTAAALARTIYEDRAFDRMPILADALEEASCQDADVLNHCRHASRHMRGCWVIDLLLGLQ